MALAAGTRLPGDGNQAAQNGGFLRLAESVMKIARFISRGRTVRGTWQHGVLIDPSGETHDRNHVQFLLPVSPGKVLALALNYKDHAAELEMKQPEEPALFWKPNTSLLPHRGTVIYPHGAKYMHYECELAVVIGPNARRVKAKDAYHYIAGYTIANDLVVRDYVTDTLRPPLPCKGWET